MGQSKIVTIWPGYILSDVFLAVAVVIRELKKLRRQLQGQCLIKIELCVKSLAIIPC